MARADLLVDLIKYGLSNDQINFRKASEAVCADEKLKQHVVVASKISNLLNKTSRKQSNGKFTPQSFLQTRESANTFASENSFVSEKIPQLSLDCLILSESVKEACNDLILEQKKSDLLNLYGISPRNKVLLCGPPGNGKTSLAEAIAESLMVPLLTVRYERIIGSYLGETALRLSQLFEYVRSKQCVLFFDEFETLAKERGDLHETGEIKRVVSSLLLQIDSLPSYVVAIAATNHGSLLDSAAWRRFQVRLNLLKPNEKDLENYYSLFEKEKNIKFGIAPKVLAKNTLGCSYAEAEEFSLSILRRYILELPKENIKSTTMSVLRAWQNQHGLQNNG